MKADRFGKMVWQAAALIGLAAAAALGVNALRPGGIPLIQDWSPAARLQAVPEGDTTISLELAIALHQSGEALFVDARSPELFAEGRISGSINLPWEGVFEHLERIFRAAPDYGTTIIAYCEGAGSSLSRELVLLLRGMGYDNARELVDGWGVWKASGYPVASNGPAPPAS